MVEIIVATLVALVVLGFIISEKINRVIVVFAGAVVMILLGHALGFYSQEEALLDIDFNTLGLLFGMMVIVSILKKTGFFTYIAINLAKLSKGRPVMIMLVLGVSTAFISMLVDNVTTIIIIMPITVLVCDILAIMPLPILMAEVLMSNIGGVATLVGDPPNVVIGSASGYGFMDFIIHLFPVTIFAIAISYYVLRFIYRKELRGTPRNFEAILNIDARKAIKNPKGMSRSLFALGVTFILFFVHEDFHLYPSFIALVGAALSFILLRPDPEEIFHDIEWPVLAFFACFFVIVGGLDRVGALSEIAKKMSMLARVDMRVYKISLLWLSAILSCAIDNVPFTMVMIPVIKSLSNFGVDTSSLWWVLAAGVGFGGNGLPIGSTAGILSIAISKKSRAPITTKIWLRSGSVVTFCSLLFLSILIMAGVF